jgi:hypothetical protein
MNATEATQRYHIQVAQPAQASVVRGGYLSLGPAQSMWVAVTVQLHAQAVEQLHPGSHPLIFRIEQLHPLTGSAINPKPIGIEEKSTFLLPH